MKMSDILALVRAGYSRQEIETMGGEEPDPKPEPEPKPEPKPEPDTGDTLAELMQQMRGVVEAMQMQARNAAQQPPEETTDDIIANIICPKGGKGGKK